MTTLEEKLIFLEAKDTSTAYRVLQELESLSEESAVLYPYLPKFQEMITSRHYVQRVRGFRLYCKQAKWDTSKQIDESLEQALVINLG